MRTHGCPETTIDLQNSKFTEDGRVVDLLKLIIGHDLLRGWRLDLVPVAAENLVCIQVEK